MKLFIRHPEFPAFRHQLAPMKAARARLAGNRRLHALEAAAGKFLPGESLHELGELPGTRSRWLQLPLIFWAFLSMVLNPGTPCREAQRAVQAWWKRLWRLWQSTCANAFCMARSRLPLDWLRRLWWRMAVGIAAAVPDLPGCHDRRVMTVDGTIIQTPDTAESQQFWPSHPHKNPAAALLTSWWWPSFACAAPHSCGPSTVPSKAKSRGFLLCCGASYKKAISPSSTKTSKSCPASR